jgi:hypothetical protein
MRGAGQEFAFQGAHQRYIYMNITLLESTPVRPLAASLLPGRILCRASIELRNLSADLMEIESAKLTTCDVVRDGAIIRLKFVDVAGNAVTLRLPFDQAGALTMTLPHLLTRALKERHGDENSRFVYPLGGWLLEGVADGRSLIVTLKTTDGFEVSFAAPVERFWSLASDLRRESAVATVAPSRTN